MNLVRFVLLCLIGWSLTPEGHAQDPRITSWYTEGSGRYARLFPTITEEASGTPVTTWSRGQGTQAQPTYAGVHEVCYSPNWVYVRATGLGSHIMGPWYGNEAQTNLFPNYPANRGVLYRVPRNPTVPGNKTLTGLGVIGIFVDGVSMFDSRDAFSYSNANAADERPNSNFNGDDIWNRDAYVNESVTFDPANAHQAGSNYHYHANPPGLRHLLGDSVDYDPNTNTYTENPSAMKHSPILGWVRDGYPVYGPYGYSDPNNPDSGVRRMSSGYQKRDGTNGTTNLAVTGRTTLPPWASAAQNRPATLAANQFGPAVSAQYVLGHYIEDYDYKGDLGMTHGVDFDLDQYNGRVCVTPEFPGGTYAYFVAMEADGTPVYPYNIGRWYYGNPTGNNVANIQEVVTMQFEGGPEKVDEAGGVTVDPTTGDVLVTWDGVQGADYEVDYSSNLAIWKTMDGSMTATSDTPGAVDAGLANSEEQQFYRVRRVGLQPFDANGFDFTPQSYETLTTITVTISGAVAAPADLNVDPIGLSFNGQTAILVGRPAQDQIEIRVPIGGLPEGDYPVSVTFDGASGVHTGNVAIGGGPVTTSNNILLLILDDWGIDMSPIDNTEPGVTLPKMPTLQSLASSGLRFTNAYSQPICSPTRATILTGRHPFRHGVGNPQANSTLAASELPLPAIFTAQSSPYGMASFGKWHLGGNTSGPFTRGRWPYFKGIRGGGVPDYNLWPKLEVINGVATEIADHPVYTTTDQVNDAVSWLGAQGSNPWFCWMAFNAPHDPFHEPPAGLAPEGGYTNPGDTSNAGMYRRMLEALDTEISRLLGAVDLSKTNVILIGDNGTPNQVVQAPFGNGNAKGDLYQGGVHVPLVATGPDVTVPAGSTSDTLVHCVDLFSTILELAGIDSEAATTSVDTIDSKSLLPILQGGVDLEDRCVVVEKFGLNAFDGRAMISDAYPDYKLVIFGDRLSDADTPSFEFYNITNDINEQSPLNIAGLTGEALAAYDHLIAKDAALGGGYSDPAAGGGGGSQTVYINLPNPGTPAVPPLIAAMGPNAGNALHPTDVTIGGQPATFDNSALPDGNPASRVNSLGNSDRYSVEVTFDPTAAGLTSGTYPIVVTFPGSTPRVFTATNSFVVP